MSAFLSKAWNKGTAKLKSTTTHDPLASHVSNGNSFSTAKTTDGLFTRTQPDVDGEDCLHDCSSCTIKLPRKWEIDENDRLYGEIKGWSRHILVATGKTDWVRDVEDEKDSIMQAMGKHGGKVQGGRLMLSASNIPTPDHASDGPYGADRPTSVLLLPAFQWIDNVTPNDVPDFITTVLNTASTNTTPLTESHNPSAVSGSSENGEKFLPASLSIRNCQHKHIVLLCSQGTRDARCGQSAPLLRRELERHLRPLGLFRDLDDDRPGGVGIYFISHVGGHKYSANMMVYRRGSSNSAETNGAINGNAGNSGTDSEATQCIWLARIRPEDCENIVKYTILQGKVVKPEQQLRGGFDREKGVISW